MAVQAINLLTPLAVLPHVLRVLNAADFGKVVLYQALAQYLMILIDFGFQFSATKHIAIIRDDPDELARYVSVVQTSRLLLAGLSLIVGLSFLFLVPSVRQDSSIYLACLVSIVGTLLTPMWLFAGLERIALAATVVACAKILTIPLTYILVYDPSHTWRYALINSAAAVLSGMACAWLIVRWRLVTGWVTPGFRALIQCLKGGWHYFLSSAAVSFYSATNPILLGLVSSSTQVAYFGAADRIRMMSLAPLQPISSAYYPVISRLYANDPSAAFKLLRVLFCSLVSLMAATSLFLLLSAPAIVGLLMGPKYDAAVPVLRIMSGIPALIAINTVLGPLAIMAIGMKRQASRIIISCGAGNLLLMPALGSLYGARGAAISLLLTEALVAVCLAATLYRHLRRDGGKRIAPSPEA